MKCSNPSCGAEWTPPPGRSVTACPFCQEPLANEKKPQQSLDNVKGTLVYIKEQLGEETLLGRKAYTYFADLTRSQFRDETDLMKLLCEKGSLDCLKDAIGKPASEHEAAIKRAVSKLPKYLQDSPTVADMLHEFAAVLGWSVQRQTVVTQPIQNPVITQSDVSINTSIIATPAVGSIKNLAGIEWRILAVENNRALLISEKILEKRPYNDDLKQMTWENCTLRKYLNGEFFDKLGEMKPKIPGKHNGNYDNPWFGTPGGNTTFDKVFLLSLGELIKYFGDSGDLANKQCKDNEGNLKSDGSYIFDRYNTARIANYKSEGPAAWRLRSPGLSRFSSACVNDKGLIDVWGTIIFYDTIGIRPALWMNL